METRVNCERKIPHTHRFLESQLALTTAQVKGTKARAIYTNDGAHVGRDASSAGAEYRLTLRDIVLEVKFHGTGFGTRGRIRQRPLSWPIRDKGHASC